MARDQTHVPYITGRFFNHCTIREAPDCLISFLDISLLMYKNVTDLRMLILYPEILLHLLVSSRSFLMESKIFRM